MQSRFLLDTSERDEVLCFTYQVGEIIHGSCDNLIDFSVQETLPDVWHLLVRVYTETDQRAKEESSFLTTAMKLLKYDFIRNPLYELKVEKKKGIKIQKENEGRVDLDEEYSQAKAKNWTLQWHGPSDETVFYTISTAVSLDKCFKEDQTDPVRLVLKPLRAQLSGKKPISFSVPKSLIVPLFIHLAKILILTPTSGMPVMFLALEAQVQEGLVSAYMHKEYDSIDRMISKLIQEEIYDIIEKEKAQGKDAPKERNAPKEKEKNLPKQKKVQELDAKEEVAKKSAKEAKPIKIDDDLYDLLQQMSEWSLKGDEVVATGFGLKIREDLVDSNHMKVVDFPLQSGQEHSTLQALLSLVDGSLLKSQLFQFLAYKEVKSKGSFQLGSHPRGQASRLVMGFLSIWQMQPSLLPGVVGVRMLRLKSHGDSFIVEVLLQDTISQLTTDRLSALPHLILN